MLAHIQLTDELDVGYTYHMKMELVVIDRETGEEEELMGIGSLQSLERLRDSTYEQAEDDGYDIPWMRIQPAS